MDSIDIMKKSIRCLRLELPEPVMKEFEKKWSRVEFYISWLKYQINEYGSHKADCEIYRAKNECSCGYEQQESDLIMRHAKEIEMRNGIMDRQKKALGKKDKEIERVRKIIKSRDSRIFNLYIKIFPGDAWVDAEQALTRIYDEATAP